MTEKDRIACLVKEGQKGGDVQLKPGKSLNVVRCNGLVLGMRADDP